MNENIKKVVEIANTYMEEHDGELPILIVAHNQNETRIIQGRFRKQHEQADQSMFTKVMRLAMILYNFTHYEFVMKPVFKYESLQMSQNVFVIGSVSGQEKYSEFFEADDNKLIPYFEKMPIAGFISQLLPTEGERQLEFKPKAEKQIRLYVENSTYNMPVKETKVASAVASGLDALLAKY